MVPSPTTQLSQAQILLLPSTWCMLGVLLLLVLCCVMCVVLCDVMCCVWHDTNCPAQASRVSAWAMWAPWAQLQLWHFIWFRVSRYSIVYLFLVQTKNKPVNKIIARTLHNFLSKILKSIMNKWSMDLVLQDQKRPDWSDRHFLIILGMYYGRGLEEG